MKKITYKQIEASRNRRLWITTVLVPATTLAVTVLTAFPEARSTISTKAKRVTRSIKGKLKKESKSDKRTIISIHAKNQNEALGALEALAKEVFEVKQTDRPIDRKVQVKEHIWKA